MKYEGKNIGILGLGKSGYWSAKLAKSLNNNVFVILIDHLIQKHMEHQ